MVHYLFFVISRICWFSVLYVFNVILVPLLTLIYVMFLA